MSGFTGQFVVTADHPSLPGHFPGAPIVPGVVLLDHVFELIGVALDAQVTLSWVKFVAPVLPGETVDVEWHHGAGGTSFRASTQGRDVLRGKLQ